jgi:hypothetical protein
MGARRIETDPERVARGRQLYENTLTPTREIAAMLGLSRNTLDNRITEWKWLRRNYSRGGPVRADTPPVAAPAPVSAQPMPAAQAEALPPGPVELPADFAARLQRILNIQFDVVEDLLKVLKPANPAEAERASRTLAVVSRTVQDIKATASSAGAMPPNDADDPVPRDIDEFRFALARRIRGFIEARRNGADRVSGAGETALD